MTKIVISIKILLKVLANQLMLGEQLAQPNMMTLIVQHPRNFH